MVGRAECVGLLYSMLGKGWSRWDWMECVGMLYRCLGIACSVRYMIYYAASLLFLLCFIVLLYCMISYPCGAF